MTTATTLPLCCTQASCLCTTRVPIETLDVYPCGSDAVCRCHPLTFSEAIDVRAFECGGKS